MELTAYALDVLVDALVVFLKLAIPALPAFEPRLRFLRWKRSRLAAEIAAERASGSPRSERLRALQTRFTSVSEAFLSASQTRAKRLRSHSMLYRFLMGILTYVMVGRLLGQLHFVWYLESFRGGRNYFAILPPGAVADGWLARLLAFGVPDPAPGTVGYLALEFLLAIPLRPMVRLLLPPYDTKAVGPMLLQVLRVYLLSGSDRAWGAPRS